MEWTKKTLSARFDPKSGGALSLFRKHGGFSENGDGLLLLLLLLFDPPRLKKTRFARTKTSKTFVFTAKKKARKTTIGV